VNLAFWSNPALIISFGKGAPHSFSRMSMAFTSPTSAASLAYFYSILFSVKNILIIVKNKLDKWHKLCYYSEEN